MATTDIDIKEQVRSRYGAIAKHSSSCCGPKPQDAQSKRLGYTDEDLSVVPEGANLGLGCGNPLGLAALAEGQTVLDLGSGAGFDCFLAANKVGKTGRVIGVDMTDAMLDKARANAKTGGYDNVEFRKGEIEALPVDDASVDVITSNCVINLSPDKPAVFAETYRVLKPGGRAFVSDIVLLKPLPDSVAKSVGAYTACVGGAVMKDEYIEAIRQAGFSDVKITSETPFASAAMCSDDLCGDTGWLGDIEDMPREDLQAAVEAVVSINVELRK